MMASRLMTPISKILSHTGRRSRRNLFCICFKQYGVLQRLYIFIRQIDPLMFKWNKQCWTFYSVFCFILFCFSGWLWFTPQWLYFCPHVQCSVHIQINNGIFFILLASSMLKSLRFTGTVQNLGLTRGIKSLRNALKVDGMWILCRKQNQVFEICVVLTKSNKTYLCTLINLVLHEPGKSIMS